MKICKNYFVAKNVSQAVEALATFSGSAKLIAGGTDVLLDIQQNRMSPPDLLVDVTEIPEMQTLEIRNGKLFIGAAVPHNRISNDPQVKKNARALAEACGLIGGPQVRNVASLGGNVGHALPAADGTIALMALDAIAEVANFDGRRFIPLAELFLGPGKNSLGSAELIVGFVLPLKQGSQASAFRRVMRPQGVAIAILNCAVWIDREQDIIQDIRISIGPSGPVPKRLGMAEDHLRGCSPTFQKMEEAVQAVSLEAKFRSSRYRATQNYRKLVASSLLKECVETAWEWAGYEGINNGS